MEGPGRPLARQLQRISHQQLSDCLNRRVPLYQEPVESGLGVQEPRVSGVHDLMHRWEQPGGTCPIQGPDG